MENIICKQAKEQGFETKRVGHALELRQNGKLLARFTETGMEIMELQVEPKEICPN